MTPKTILVPISYAPSSVKAFGTAATLAASYGAKLIAMHVVRPPKKVFYSPGGLGFDELLEKTKIEESNRLDGFVKDNLEAANVIVDVERMVLEGEDHVELIIDVARKNGVDLIVVGHHEEMHLEHFLFGRDVDRIVDGADCDVIVTRTRLYKELGRKKKKEAA